MNDDPENLLAEEEPIEEAPVVDAPPVAGAPLEEPTVGTGSYIGASCALAMLVLTIVLIGVIYLLRWIG